VLAAAPATADVRLWPATAKATVLALAEKGLTSDYEATYRTERGPRCFPLAYVDGRSRPSRPRTGT
jgi:hypothetical protein